MKKTAFFLPLLILASIAVRAASPAINKNGGKETRSTKTRKIAAPKKAAKKPRIDKKPALQEIRKKELTRIIAKEFGEEKALEIFSDPRLQIDRTLFVGVPGPKKRITYFSPEFGLLTEESLRRGEKCFAENRSDFEKIEGAYGVPPEIILGILRLETNFGRLTGKRAVINTLYTLYLFSHKAKKREFALIQFKSFLRLTLKNGWDAFAINGSWVGALGIPQFIPSSYLLYAVDGDGDGKIDLFSTTDAIWSVGNFLKSNGWGNTEKSKIKALYSYNREKIYGRAVLAYAATEKKIIFDTYTVTAPDKTEQ